jgi:cysteinyl-tRNA synthetase
MEVRYVLAAGHYRRPLNFRLQSLHDARLALQRLAKAERQLAAAAGRDAPPSYESLVQKAAANGPVPGPFAEAWRSLLDDLNVPEALGHVFSTLRESGRRTMGSGEALPVWHGLHLVLAALGLVLPAVEEETAEEAPEGIRILAQKRWEAKQAKDWAAADALRGELDALGWVVKDAKDGFELAKK